MWFRGFCRAGVVRMKSYALLIFVTIMVGNFGLIIGYIHFVG